LNSRALVTKLSLLIIFLWCGYASAQTGRGTFPEVVPQVDLPRYAGKWYEIARLPNKYEKRCAGDVTATYTQLEKGRLEVVNECRQQDGRIYRAKGEARLATTTGPNSKLRVRFAPAWLAWLPMVWGAYCILYLADDYSHAIVGSPDRQYVWILSRSTQMDDRLYGELAARLSSMRFDAERLIRTRHAF
jgi:apolipoprotein D and lipocalin family protein